MTDIERYNLRIGYVGGALDKAPPTHLYALSHATEGEVLHEYVRADAFQGAVADRDRLQRVVDEAYGAADGSVDDPAGALYRVLEVLAPHVGGQ